MGGKSSPDFGQVAATQEAANRQTINDQLFANRPNQYSPWGATTWTQDQIRDPATGEMTTAWNQTTSLTPELQDILNKQIAIQGGRTDIAGGLTGRIGSEFLTPMDWSGLNPMGQVPTAQYTLPEGDIGSAYETRQRAEDAMWQQAQSRLEPQQQAQREALELRMRNQGLRPGDAAWESQMQNLGQQHTDQTNQALWSSVGEGRQEAGQMWNQLMGQNQNLFNQALQANAQNWQQSLAGSQYANQIRQQQIAEAMQKRGFNLNEINALLSGQQVGMPSMPNFSQAGAAEPGDYMGAAAQNASMQNAQNPWASILGAGAQLGSAYLMSDRRLKRDITPVGKVAGYDWYTWNYIWGEPGHGVMADEVPAEHVTEIGGFKAVNYGTLLGD